MHLVDRSTKTIAVGALAVKLPEYGSTRKDNRLAAIDLATTLFPAPTSGSADFGG
jgi:hypothetical protein